MLGSLTGIFGSRPSRKLLTVPNSPSCQIGKASLSTLVRFNNSKCACETSILAKIASLSSCQTKKTYLDTKGVHQQGTKRIFNNVFFQLLQTPFQEKIK